MNWERSLMAVHVIADSRRSRIQDWAQPQERLSSGKASGTRNTRIRPPFICYACTSRLHQLCGAQKQLRFTEPIFSSGINTLRICSSLPAMPRQYSSTSGSGPSKGNSCKNDRDGLSSSSNEKKRPKVASSEPYPISKAWGKRMFSTHVMSFISFIPMNI